MHGQLTAALRSCVCDLVENVLRRRTIIRLLLLLQNDDNTVPHTKGRWKKIPVVSLWVNAKTLNAIGNAVRVLSWNSYTT